MSTNSDRHRCQLFVEYSIGCFDASELNGKEEDFKNFSITASNINRLREESEQDALSFFRKGANTFLQGLAGLARGEYSWAVVKFYYSLFYLMRADLASDGLVVLRCKSTYSLELSVGEQPKRHTGARYRGDHIAATSLYQDRFIDRDLLLTQTIDDVKSGYEWMRDQREWVHYRNRDFIDGQAGLFDFSAMSLHEQVRRYFEDTVPIYCFDPDYAALAFPLKKLQLSTAAASRVEAVHSLSAAYSTATKLGYQECLDFIELVTS